jgi:hypothetical protein
MRIYGILSRDLLMVGGQNFIAHFGARLTHRPDHGSSKSLRNVGQFIPNYTAKYSRSQSFSSTYFIINNSESAFLPWFSLKRTVFKNINYLL